MGLLFCNKAQTVDKSYSLTETVDKSYSPIGHVGMSTIP